MKENPDFAIYYLVVNKRVVVCMWIFCSGNSGKIAPLWCHFMCSNPIRRQDTARQLFS